MARGPGVFGWQRDVLVRVFDATPATVPWRWGRQVSRTITSPGVGGGVAGGHWGDSGGIRDAMGGSRNTGGVSSGVVDRIVVVFRL